MAFTTIAGAGASDKTSYVGTSGQDNIAIVNSDGNFVVGGQAGGDSIQAINTGNVQYGDTITGAIIRAGAGADAYTSSGVLNYVGTIFNGNKDGDTLTFGATDQISASSVFGGQGTDTLNLGIIGSTLVNGHKDGDTININGNTITSTIRGGQGTDTILLANNLNTTNILGDNDNDTINVGTTVNVTTFANSQINGNAGNDSIVVGAGGTGVTAFDTASTIRGGGGRDTINANFAGNTVGLLLSGDNNQDSISATGNADTLAGGTGSDTLNGQAGTDSIQGGVGSDSYTGGAGNDTFSMNAGTDSISDLFGSDAFVIGTGNTMQATVTADFTSDTNSSNLGFATLTLANTIDANLTTVSGTVANQNGYTITAAGNLGSSTVDGSALADTITGGNAAAGDTIDGNAGNDTITGAQGADSMTGSAGADQFTQTNGATAASTATTDANGNIANGETITVAADRITDFTGGTDILDTTAGVAAVVRAAGQTVDSTVNNGEILIRGNFAAGVFTVAAAGNDVLYADFTNGAGAAVVAGTQSTVLVGQGANIAAIAAGNFV